MTTDATTPTGPTTPLRVEWATLDHEAALTALFDRDGSPCFCRYWHFEGDKNAWLDRCAHDPGKNASELRADLATGEPRAKGLVALTEDGTVVGWMKLAPRATLPKLRGLSVYRAHDLGDDEGVWSIGCFLVDPARRHEGVAKALVTAAPELLRTAEPTARALEAYPREGIHATESWTGPKALFARFSQIGGEDPYPVLRLAL